ncbi:hypothetical protein ACUN24_09445 [Pedobacter sp. WC2501]|uniref:hypothetical protein n=1 Tax=Pedobacter sp. WC2501 TaxID=3461400 RepID=UPI00404601A3
MRTDDFSQTVKDKVAERAAHICSNPTCNRITIGPDNTNPMASTKGGIAAHICAASPGGARYDMSQTPAQRSSIANAIWLCASCALIIDKNNGLDYPAPDLRKWKIDHEKLIKECLEGSRRVIFQFQKLTDQAGSCRQIIKFLEQRGALFVDLNHEIPYYVFESVKEIRTFLTQMQTNIIPESPLEVMIDSINMACRVFMNTTTPNISMTELSYSLGAMRKIVGLNLLDMGKVYGVKITGDLNKILLVN